MTEYICSVCGSPATERLHYWGGAMLTCDTHKAEVELEVRTMCGRLLGRDEIIQTPEMSR